MYLIDVEEKRSLISGKLDLYLLFTNDDTEENHRLILTDVFAEDWENAKNKVMLFANSDLDCEWCWDDHLSFLYLFDRGARFNVAGISADSILHIREDWE